MTSNVWICGYRVPKQFKTLEHYKCFNPNSYNEKININDLNRFWSEYVLQYYVYKNNIKSDIITFCHDHRIINNDTIDYEKILNQNSVQIYEETYIPYNRYNVEFPAFYGWIVVTQNIPIFVYNDFVEFIETQNIISQDNINEQGKAQKLHFIMREFYSCTWDVFLEMQEFLEGYFNFICDKYNIHNQYDYIWHIITKILEHYRKFTNLNKLAYYEKRWQNDKSYMEMNNSATLFGYEVQCNQWRTYSYMIELLVSIFINSKTFFVKNEGCFIYYSK